MPLPKDLVELLSDTARIRDEERAMAHARATASQRAEEEAKRRLSRERDGARPSAEAITRWLEGPEAAQLRAFKPITLLGPVWEDAGDADALRSGTWKIGLSRADRALYIIHRAGPAWGFDKDIPAEKLIDEVPPAILDRLARMLGDGSLYAALQARLGDKARERREAKQAADDAEECEILRRLEEGP